MPNTLTRSALLRPLLVLLTILSACSISFAQEDVNSAVQLIPKPRQIQIKRDKFQLANNTRIVLAAPRSEDDRFAAADFSNDVRETAKLSLRTAGSKARHSILIGSLDLPVIQAAIKRLGVNVPANLNPEGYVLAVNANEVVVGERLPRALFMACKL